VAIDAWTHAVQQRLDMCVPRASRLRRQVGIDVLFSPGPRASGEPRQELAASAIELEPGSIDQLPASTDPEMVQRCLDQARAIPLAVSLAPSVRAHRFPTSAERLIVEL
jgi:hypothetical protein